MMDLREALAEVFGDLERRQALSAAVAGVTALTVVITYLVVGPVTGTSASSRDGEQAAALGDGAGGGPECRLTARTGVRALTPAQAKAATTLVAVGRRRDVPQRTMARALDSVLGDGAAKPLTARQAAESLAAHRSGPAASAEGQAAVQALTGARPGALVCAYPRRFDLPEQRMGASGLTPRAAALRKGYQEVFGKLPAGGFAPGGIRSGHVDNSAHYDGRAIDVFFRPVSAGNRRDGWVFAQWLVAHADSYDLLSIIFDDRIWTVWASFAGWRRYVHPSGNTRNPVLRHRDHVHVAVVRGGRPRR